jgi:hypothetical protein
MPKPVKEYIAELGGWQGFTVGSCSRYDFSARDVPSLIAQCPLLRSRATYLT